ncbi:hypothetical protein BDN72DRAFT_889355 [Pluteus cervinus]|uniref:Uncharacterized protein n=1 Tax=Pluteus cervinus TaxID=181527 RepID=A0ACD3AJK4_9AGAR|nr:hypothetical protein BDN72DRAFT_889355 [Pluteus cervinus]
MSEPDIIFSSVDCVLFYADTHIIAKASPGAFQSLISAPSTPGAEYEAPPGSMRIIPVPESSIVLNIILHSLYGNSCAQYSPSLEALLEAVHHMPSYGISPSTHITRTTHLYSALLAYSPLHPLELYALAAQYKIHDLAVTTSSHLLSCSLSSITDELAERIGSIYLKRLFDLHLIRFNALREMLLSPPHPHPSTKDCNFVDQKGLTRAWALVSAYLAWDARADLSTHSMKLAFGPLAECLSCDDCKNCLQAKLHDVIAKWASVKLEFQLEEAPNARTHVIFSGPSISLVF